MKKGASSLPVPAARPPWWVWTIPVLVFFLLLWVFSGVLPPFLIGMLIAYLLDPPVRRLNDAGVPRVASAAVVLLLFVAIVALAILFLGPLLQTQAKELIDSLPDMLERARNYLLPRLEKLSQVIPGVSADQMRAALAQRSVESVDLAGTLLGRVVQGGMAFVSSLAFAVFTPVIAFYLLRDWPKMLHAIDSVLPRRLAPAIRREARAVDNMIAGFVRGQAMVCLCLGTFYATGLHLIGLEYGMLLGIVMGVLAFIPTIGTMIGAFMVLALSLLQFSSLSDVALAVLVFLGAQTLDGYLLTPNLVGSRVGLHPVWIIFSVLAGAYLFGFFGVLFAVPVAGTIAILLRSAVRVYHETPYYKATDGEA